MASHPSRLGPADIFVALVMNLLWGLNIIAIKMSVDQVPPTTAAFLRLSIVFLVCLPWLRIVPGRMRALLLLGLLTGCLFFLVINLSLMVATNVGVLAIAGQLGVPFSMLAAVIVLKEQIHVLRIAGVALSLAGVGILAFDPAVANEIPGVALTILSSIIWAGASLIQRSLKGVPVLTIYAWIGLVGMVGLSLSALLIEPAGIASIPDLPPAVFGWIAFSAIGSSVIGHGSMSWLLQRHPISQVMPLTLAAPVMSVAAASLFFGTPLTPIMILGGLIALSGVAIVTIRTAKVAKKERPPQVL
ncbi:DMT family transporter [Sphingosinicella rhizophila]|uniref:DMT family transporter n=1 Tax=Sphingosinicella rhizophila TaxID=3050082 RepID=A0ABU3QBS8_9SPHN|nr:DMT family transporter [Sphingosinicella sp. GR2756]MDT9600737.1 DMT family transporter [Sphingosinicella sp. GR2756]